MWQAQSQNLPVEHRADINPVAWRAARHGSARQPVTGNKPAALRHIRRAMMNTQMHGVPRTGPKT